MSATPLEYTTPLYSRIRVTPNENDMRRLLPLIHEYIDHPDHAASVKEFVYRAQAQQSFSWRSLDKEMHALNNQNEVKEVNRNVEGEGKLRSALSVLGLEPEAETQWLRYLTWMKPELVAEREKDKKHFMNFDTKHDALFAQHAGALLLMMCPNIEKLTYEDNDGPANAVLKRNNDGKLPGKHLQRLRELRLLHADGALADERFFEFLDPLLVSSMFNRLPLLEKLSMEFVGPNNDAGFREEFPPASSNVRYMHLSHVEMPSTVYGALIHAPKQLEELMLSEGGRATMDGTFVRDLKTLASALGRHRSTLRNLDLDLVTYWQFHEPEDEGDAGRPPEQQTSAVNEYHGVLDFKDYDKLTHLSIGIHSMLGEAKACFDGTNGVVMKVKPPPVSLLDSLPTSLEYLMIRGYAKGEHPHYDAEIDRLMAEMSVRLPKLEKVDGVEEYIPFAEFVEDPDEAEASDEEDGSSWEPGQRDQDWVEEIRE